MSSRNVVVVGAGGVLGEALCREFVPDSRVVALRRPGSAPVKVEGVRTLPCSSLSQIQQVKRWPACLRTMPWI